MNKIKMPLVLLAGGKSSRMNTNKTLLPFANETLISYQYNRLKPYFQKIYISTKKNQFQFDNILFDQYSVYSPLYAIKSIFEQINYKKIFILAVDTPFVTINTIKQIIKQSDSYDITVAKTNFRHNLCGVYNKNIISVINQMVKSNNHKLGLLLEQSKTNYILFSDENEFLNLNTLQEYQKAISLLKDKLV